MPLRRQGLRGFRTGPPPTAGELTAAFPTTPGVYLHIPFCRSTCPFCPYNKVRHRPQAAAAYMAALETEAALHLAEQTGPFPSLYVGGGTPTLCLDGLESLLRRFPVTGERAIEVLPGDMTATTADHIASIGFDYVSLGVQSFDARVLRRLGRPGTPRQSRAAIENSLGRFACVDVDLIFDTAYDDPGVLLADLTTCFEYGVDQVSTYPLMRFGYTPLGKGRHHRRREHALLAEAAGLARSHGYRRRSVWTFNRAGAPSYTSITRPYFLGMGAGSATFAGRLFTVNHFGLTPYLDAVRAGRLPVARTARLSPVAAAAYRTFWQAYTGSIPIGSGDPLLAHPLAAAARLTSRALRWTRRGDGRLELTPAGYDRYHDLERWVTYRFIEPLWAGMMEEHRQAPGPEPTGGTPSP